MIMEFLILEKFSVHSLILEKKQRKETYMDNTLELRI